MFVLQSIFYQSYPIPFMLWLLNIKSATHLYQNSLNYIYKTLSLRGDSMQDNYLKKELYDLVKSSDEIFNFLQKGALDGLWYWDLENMENEWMSPKFWETFGFDPKTRKHLAKEWQNLIHPDDLKKATEALNNHLADKNNPYDLVVRYKHKSGSTVWVRCRGYAIRDESDKPIRMLGAHTDITTLKEAEEDLERLKHEYETVFNGTQDAMFLIKVLSDHQFMFIRNNQSHQNRTGITLELIKNKTPYDLLGDEEGKIVSENYQRCVDAKEPISYEETLELPAGKRIWHTTLSPIIENNTVTYIVGSATDITLNKALEKDLERRANYDSLTNLMNRGFLYKKLTEFTQHHSTPFTIFFIDLDDFKCINDTYGHKAGDTVLQTIGARINKLLNQSDCAARLGGDEFALVIKSMQDTQDINSFKDQVLQAINQPITLKDTHKISVNASIGHAIFPVQGKSYDDLLHHSDEAMYKMKQNNNQ